MALNFGNTSTFSVTMEGPFGSAGLSIRLVELSLPAGNWKGAVSPFSQVVTLPDINILSKVDLQPSIQQLEAFRTQELALTTQNEDGVLTVYAIGQCPGEDITLQATITEVST